MKFNCPHCNAKLEIPDDDLDSYIDADINCPTCGEAISIDLPESEPEPQPEKEAVYRKQTSQLIEEQAEEPPTRPSDYRKRPAQKPQEKKKQKKSPAPLIAVGIILVIGIAGGLMGYFGNRKETSKSTSKQAPQPQASTVERETQPAPPKKEEQPPPPPAPTPLESFEVHLNKFIASYKDMSEAATKYAKRDISNNWSDTKSKLGYYNIKQETYSTDGSVGVCTSCTKTYFCSDAKYDVYKTDSLVSPFSAVITFTQMEKIDRRWKGEPDTTISSSGLLTLNFAYQNSKWVLTGGKKKWWCLDKYKYDPLYPETIRDFRLRLGLK